MTCKDCIHYEVCGYGLVKPEDAVCDSFKDKSRFVELPCKVGDRVYFHDLVQTDDCEAHYYVDDAVVIAIRIELGGVKYITWNMVFSNKDFGKTVFLTLEEAEAKLKEMQDVKR